MNKYQGVTPRKTHRTALCDSPRAAAIASAQMTQRIALCHLPQNNAAVTISASVSLPDFGAAASGVAGVSSRPLGPISCALLRPEQAAAAVARGVAVANHDVPCFCDSCSISNQHGCTGAPVKT